MTRRKFVRKLIKVCSVVIAGTSALAVTGRRLWNNSRITKKVKSRKCLRAIGVRGYPGPLKPLQDICEQGKWSG